MTREEAINNLNMISVAFVEAETKEQRKIIDDTFNMAIKALEQEPKTGRWINRHIIANTSIDMIVCSECGEEFSYDAETGISEYNFCPNCGAKMVQESEVEK